MVIGLPASSGKYSAEYKLPFTQAGLGLSKPQLTVSAEKIGHKIVGLRMTTIQTNQK